MLYADRIASSPERPSCWGNKDSFDPEDSDCQECRFQHSCRQEVNSRRMMSSSTVPLRTGTTSYRPSAPADTSNWAPGLTYEGESPLARLVKDGAVGAIRGMFYEGWRFMTNFRIK